MLELVGVGGMGRVYRAEQRMLGRTVAIKVIHPHLLSDEQSVARFYTEARAASRLNHPNSVSIIDFGRTDDGILYLVMEYLQGKDLARLMREDGPLPVARICEILSSVLDALAISGVEPGSLRSRLTGLEGRVRAKTGSMRNTASLSGFVTADDGRDLAFVIVANTTGTPTSATNRAIDEIVRAIAMH